MSMTINGPAPMMLAFFMNAAIDQQCEIYIKENGLEKEVQEKIEKILRKMQKEGKIPHSARVGDILPAAGRCTTG